MKTRSLVIAALLSVFAATSFAAPHKAKHHKHHKHHAVKHVVKR